MVDYICRKRILIKQYKAHAFHGFYEQQKMLTTLGFPSIMFPGELGGNMGDLPDTGN